MARTRWHNTTIVQNSDLQKYEPNVTSWSITTLADKLTISKNEIAKILRLHFASLKQAISSVQNGTDGVTTASQTTFSAATGLFSTRKVTTFDRIWIETGDDKGVYAISTVGSDTSLNLSPTPTATATGLTWFIEPEILDYIKNPTLLTSAAALLSLHYAAAELVQAEGDFWTSKIKFYQDKFEEEMRRVVPDLVLDINQDEIISKAERKGGITGGKLLR